MAFPETGRLSTIVSHSTHDCYCAQVEKTFSLTAPPSRIERGQRVMLEAIGVAAEFIDFDYTEITIALDQVVAHGRSAKDPEVRVRLFRAAWSIVDRVDLIRLVLHKQAGITLAASADREQVFSVCCHMRNAMDHLGSNAQKHQSLRNAYPIFGLISFNWNKADDFITRDGRRLLLRQNATLVSASSFQHRTSQNSKVLFNDRYYEGTFGNVNLFAFDKQLSIDLAVKVVRDIREVLNRALIETAPDDDKPLYGPMEFTITQNFDDPVDIGSIEP